MLLALLGAVLEHELAGEGRDQAAEDWGHPEEPVVGKLAVDDRCAKGPGRVDGAVGDGDKDAVIGRDEGRGAG